MEKLQMWATRMALGLALFIPVYFMAAPLGYKFDVWGLMTSFSMLTKFGPPLLMGTAGLAALALLLSAIAKRKKGILLSLIALAVPVAGLAHAKTLKDSRKDIPPIHDISTNMEDPPTFSAVVTDIRGEKSNPLNYIGKTFGKNNELVTAAQAKAYPDVQPITSSKSTGEAFAHALAIVKQMGWELQSESAATGVIEATDTTFWFGFKDDVVIRVRPAENAGSIIDVRSVSRVGRSEIGANAARIRAFSNQFNQ